MLLGDPVERSEEHLQRVPAAGRLDEAPVLHLAPVGDLAVAGFGPPEPALAHQPAGERPVGEQAHAVGETEGAHLAGRAAVEEREADLVGDDRDAVPDQQVEMARVEIGDAEAADQALTPQSVEMLHRVEIGGMLEAPPMELEKVDRLDAEAPAAALDAFAHDLGRHWTRRRAPFGEGDRTRGAGPFPRRDALKHAAGDQFGAAVMIGHVERIESGPRVVEQDRGRRLAVEFAPAALHVRHLPQAGDDPADLEVGRERNPWRRVEQQDLPLHVMAGLVPAIHAAVNPMAVQLQARRAVSPADAKTSGVDGRDKPGHDGRCGAAVSKPST